MGSVAKAVGGAVSDVAKGASNVVSEVSKGVESTVAKTYEGVVNAHEDVLNAVVIDPAMQVAEKGMGVVNKVAANPAAAGLLTAGGAALGLPPGVTGGILSTFGPQTPPSNQSAAPASAPVVVNSPAPSSGDNTMMMLMMGGGGILVLVMMMMFLNKRK